MMATKLRKTNRLSAAQLSALGFILFIGIGALGFMLPFMHQSRHDFTPLLALFESTSAVCVTGLSRVTISDYYSLWGQIWLLLLIQIGGLGYMILYSYFLIALRQKMSLRQRLELTEILSLPGPRGSLRFVLRILRFTLFIEMIGALLLAIDWIPRLGFWKGLYYSIFHAISAFNNAGFALYADSLIPFQQDPYILTIIGSLVLIGGLGYPVLSELFDRWVRRRETPSPWQWKVMSLHTRISLVSTLAFLLFGFVAYFVLETQHSLHELSWGHQLSGALFMSIMPRTAGFNALDLSQLSLASLALTSLLMFIGANPGGTGGGTKTTTWIVLVNMVYQYLQGRKEAVLLKRKISEEVQLKAVATVLLSTAWVFFAYLALSLSDAALGAVPLLFELISAFATVGLSLGITGEFSAWGQAILIATMFVGRVGILSLALSIWQPEKTSLLKYPEDQILVG